MPDVNDFIAHPRTFMRANVVNVVGPTGGLGGNMNFELLRSDGTTAVNMLLPHHPAMPVWVLQPHTDAAVTVPIWWCPYEQSGYLGATLPGAGGPNMMFTFAMDGCTFVAGSRTPNNDVRVHHVNMAGNTGLGPLAKEQQFRLQRNVAQSLVTNPQLVDPDDYYNPATRRVAIPDGAKISTVTFGRRATGGWVFYTHQWYTVQGFRTTRCFIGTQRVL